MIETSRKYFSEKTSMNKKTHLLFTTESKTINHVTLE